MGYASVDMGDPENLGVGFGILSLPIPEADTSTSGLERPPYCFRCRCRSADIGYASVDMGDPENLGVGFGILSLPLPGAEIRVLPV